MSNSGWSICDLTRDGNRQRDVDRAVGIASHYPGVTGMGAAWVLAGGQFDSEGNPVGVTSPLTLPQLAKVLKMPTRMMEAVDKNMLEKGAKRVQTKAVSCGFYVPGTAGQPLRPMAEHVAAAIDTAGQNQTVSAGGRAALSRMKGLLDDSTRI